MTYRLVQISDPHLSARRSIFHDNWEQVLEMLAADPPDLIVITGDAVLDDPDSEGDHAFARAQFERLPAPWRIIPGNHDVGDSRVAGAMAKTVSEARLARWARHWGEDRWAFPAGGWLMLGINAQTLNAPGLAQEAAQLAWLSQVLAAADPSLPIALFTHKPVFMDHPEETAVDQSALDPVARGRLLAALAGRRLRLVASGHKHQWRAFDLDGTRHVWAPSTAAVNGDPRTTCWGLREVGFVAYGLDGARVRQRLVGRDALTRHEAYLLPPEDGGPARGQGWRPAATA